MGERLHEELAETVKEGIISRLERDIERLFENNSIIPAYKVESVAFGIMRLLEYDKSNPLVDRAMDALFKYRDERYIKEISQPEFSALGTTESVCPYCMAKLEKFPQRKTKCKSCGQPIYSRTRPLDGEKVLIREDEIELLEDQWNEESSQRPAPIKIIPGHDYAIYSQMAMESDTNPEVEFAARRLFSENADSHKIQTELAARDAGFIKRVELRVWLLQVYSTYE